MVSSIAGYYTDHIIYESANSLIYRGQQRDNKLPVILKVLKSDYPTPEALARFKREYDITRSLNLDGVIGAYGLDPYRNSMAMVLEDFGGHSLARYTTGLKLPLDQLLSISIQLAGILGQIHQRNIIHKDINPANIIYNSETHQLKLIDFGISTMLSRENMAVRDPNILEGTLAYMSPEQTGRMNRSVDYRTDFYSLGATLYELAAGVLPFPTTDPIALVHSHIAKKPLAPIEVKSSIPEALSNIILKLLAKTAEERYQSMPGLKADLESCFNQWRATHQISTFALGQYDIPDRFDIPQKLYGRQAELDILMKAFERASQGQAELLLVHGPAGVGKSALVNEIQKPIVQKRGYFTAGKFDQFRQNIPYAALIQAFRDLIGQLLAEDKDSVARWRQKILTALGPNSQIIFNGIPELKLVIGSQPPIPDLGPAETQNRFKLVIQEFIKVFATAAHPLVIFLDDLQWADLATLRLLNLLIAAPDSRHLFLIGAYRKNEIDATHPISWMLNEATKTGVAVQQLSLKSLTQYDINQLLSDTLHCPPKETEALSRLVLKKTAGNPFFTNEFLKSLYQDKYVTFDMSQGRWRWHLGRIQNLAITDNVVDLLAERLKRLPDATQKTLKLAAAIGGRFNVSMLMATSNKSASETAANLWPAIQAGLILPIGDQYTLLQDELFNIYGKKNQGNGIRDPRIQPEYLEKVSYYFAHDRIQQAAYSLIRENDRKSVHLRIGQMLLTRLNENRHDMKALFDTVNQLNQGLELMSNPQDRLQLARLNLIAGKQAKSATAYDPALNYLETGIRLLAEDSWQSHYKLAQALHFEAAEAAYLGTQVEKMDTLTEILSRHVKSQMEQVRVQEIRMQSYFSQSNLKEMIATGLDILDMLGVKISRQPNKAQILMGFLQTKRILQGKSVEDLKALPKMKDPYKLAAMRILVNVGVATYFLEPDLIPLMVFKMIELSLKYGNAPQSSYGYGTYGFILAGAMQDIDQGYEFGNYALTLMDQLGADELKAKTYVVNYGFIKHWKEPINDSLASLLDAYQSGLNIGDVEFACAACVVYCYHTLFAGKELAFVEQESAKYTAATRKLRQERHVDSNAQNWQATVNLIEKTDDPGLLVGDHYDEKTILPRMVEADDRNAISSMHLYKTMLCLIFGDFPRALTFAEKANEDADTFLGSVLVPVHNFYYALALLKNYPQTSKTEQIQCLYKVRKIQSKMKKWARHAPMNYLHKFHLIEAEKARVLNKPSEAIEHYNQAITLAHKYQFLNDEALAYEMAAAFYHQQGQENLWQAHLQDANYTYLRWGAMAKVQAMYEQHPFLQGDLQPQNDMEISNTTTLSSQTRTTNPPADILDLQTFTKASQTISEVIVLSDLLKTLMEIAIENAGAQKGYLILDQDNELVVEASYTVDESEGAILLATPIKDAQNLAASVVNYVARTQESVVLDDAAQDGQFTNDPYIIANQPKSILCTPLLNQGKLSGLFYLENNLTSGAFTPDRLKILSLLSSQAAISIENAKLYTNLESLVEARTTELKKANLQLRDANEELKRLYDQQQNELLMARKIQQSLLPPNHPDWNGPNLICHTDAAQVVGGDFYTYHAFKNGGFAITVGDVSDKGMPAALLMAVSIASFQSIINQALEPSQLLCYLDNALVPYTRSTNQNCALCYIEIKGNLLRVANAGCIPPIVRRKHGAIEWVEVGGLPLGTGFGSEAGYLESTITLNRGDMVILTSDGVVEAVRSDNQFLGFDRLEQAIALGPTTSPQAMLNHLRSTVAAFAGNTEPRDDSTIVILQF